MNIQQQLDSLLKPASTGLVTISTNHGEAALQVVDAEAISCRLDSIRFVAQIDNQLFAGALTAAAEKLARNLRYLPEPLAVIESDDLAHAAQVRSYPPKQEADRVAYFECIVEPKQVVMLRYERCQPQPRRAIAFNMTREMLAQALRDIDLVFKPQDPVKKPLRG